MKRNYFGVLFLFLLLVCCRAFGGSPLISLTPLPNWIEAEAKVRGQSEPPLPTVRYIPNDHRNAELLVTILGKGDGRISNLDALRKLHLELCRQYLATPETKFSTKEIKFPHGIAVYASFEDPELIGKAPRPGDFKVVTPVALLMDGGLVGHASIFSDEVEGPTFQEALEILKTLSVSEKGRVSGSAKPESGEAIVISPSGLDAELSIPRGNLSESPIKLNDASSYFSFTTNDGLMVSGWLEPASKYQGLRKMWSQEKEKMEEGMSVKCEDESFELVGGWQTVLYVIKLPGGGIQQNLRACRVSGHTWVDVHLSKTAKTAEIEPLKVLLRSLSIRTK